MTTYSTDVYFAASEATKTIGDLSRRVENWYLRAESSGYFEKIRRSYAAYHGMYWSTSGHALSFMGDTQELVQIGINHYRNIAQHILVNITSTRPAFSSRSINSDFQSQAQANLADSLLDYYMREKRLEKYLYTAVEYAIALSAGFVMMEWSPSSGNQIDYDEELQIPIYEGDIVFSNCSPLDVITDTSKENWDDNDWIIVRSFKNRFSLMAKYPDQADKIKAVKSKAQTTVTLSTNAIGMEETDDIPIYTFMHKRCDALPQGRYLQFAGDDIILLDNPLPYKDIPIFRVSASDILGTPFGYSPMFDLLPIQDSVNSMYSAAVTNNAAFGVQNIFVPRGADLGIESLSGGLNIIEANAEPKPLNLTQSAPELYTLIKMLEQNMETLSGVNSVARGNPQDSLRSGTSLALVQSQAVQFMSGLQQQYVRLVEDVGTGLINILKEYAKTQRVANIVGKSNKAYIKEFTGQDLKSINRIVVDFSNPMSKTVAGKVQMAEQMLQYGIIKDPRDFLSVINTGQLHSVTDSYNSELLLIKSENEAMLEGKIVQVLAIDEHLKHINEHKALINDPIARSNPQLVQIVLDHIQAHIKALQTVDPSLLLVTGQQPMIPPPPPGQAPPQGAPMPPQGQPMPPRPQGGGAPVAPQGSPKVAGPKIAGPKFAGPKPLLGVMSNPSSSALNIAQPNNMTQIKLPKGAENAPLTMTDNAITKGYTS